MKTCFDNDDGHIHYDVYHDKLFVEFDEGVLDIYVHHDRDGDDTEESKMLARSWLTEGAETRGARMFVHFNIAEILDCIVESYAFVGGNQFCTKDKPAVDAFKRQLLEQVARIDSFTYVEPLFTEANKL